MLWLLSDLGIILESMDGRSLEFVDFHQSFLKYKWTQVTNNYKSNLAITGIILQHCMCKK